MNKVQAGMIKVDYYSLSLKEIELKLNIRPFKRDKYRTDLVFSTQIFDEWADVAEFLQVEVVRINTSEYRSCDVYGYELICDNHLVQVYYIMSPYDT